MGKYHESQNGANGLHLWTGLTTRGMCEESLTTKILDKALFATIEMLSLRRYLR